MHYLDDYKKVVVRSVSKNFHVENNNELEQRDYNILMLYKFNNNNDINCWLTKDDNESIKYFIKNNNLIYVKLLFTHGYNHTAEPLNILKEHYNYEILKYMVNLHGN